MMGQDWEDGFRAGDPDVFKELVTRESPRLLGYALRLTGDRATAEDLVQDVWVEAYRARRSYTGAGPLMAWLLAICRRQAWDYRRREQRQLSLSVGLSQRAEQDRESAPPDDAAGELGESAIAAIADLPEQQRNVLICRILEDRSTRETALRLGIAEGTVKATLHHALNKLRNLTRGEAHA